MSSTRPPHSGLGQPQDAADPAGRLTRTADGGLVRFDFEGLRALVVEPDDEARAAIEGALRSIGLRRTVGAVNAAKAIEAAADLDMDLLFCEVGLDYPDGPDGLQFLLDVREDKTPLPAAVPVLLFAGEAGSFSVLEAKRLGVDDFLAKPVPLKRLQAAVQRLMRARFPERVRLSQ